MIFISRAGSCRTSLPQGQATRHPTFDHGQFADAQIAVGGRYWTDASLMHSLLDLFGWPKCDVAIGEAMRRLDGLQALRGIAAVMVVVDHAMRAAILQGYAFAGLEDFAGTVGRMGVNIFFVLSGFIMTYTARETASLLAVDRARAFLHRRVARLVPLYWLATAVTILIGALKGVHYRIGNIVTSLLFLPNVADTEDWRMPPIVGVGWTLNYESMFYLIFAASLLLPRNLSVLACVGTIGLLVGGGAWALHHGPGEPWHRLIVFYGFKNIAFFAIGIIIAVALRRLPTLAAQTPLWAAVVLIGLTLTAYLHFGFVDGTPQWSGLSVLSCTAVVTLAALSAQSPSNGVQRALLHLGNASFSIYLFHAMLMDRLAAAVRPDMTPVRGAIFVAAATFGCLMFGSVIHSAIELPLGRMVRRSPSARKNYALNGHAVTPMAL